MDNAQTEPFDDFRRIELRIGTVVEVKDHPEAEKLYVLKVDLGEEESRTIVTNIKSYYPYDKMMGRKLLVVSNLKSANFRGVKSFGMLMAAEDLEMGGNSLLLLDPSVDVPNGTLMSCGMETKGLRCEMKHLEKVTIKVAKVVDGKFMGMDIELPEGAPERVAAVIDGDKAVVLGDGKGCVMTVDGDIMDGAPAL
ncbi:MAG: hypothetical protein J5945_05050 [Candidatus Methanomethylophilus sp.]|nr:hypothetical protein [Methanomethylophilus sp.]